MTDEPLNPHYYRDRYERYRDVVGLTSTGGVRANYIGEAANDVFTLAAEVDRLRALVPSHTDGTAAPAPDDEFVEPDFGTATASDLAMVARATNLPWRPDASVELMDDEPAGTPVVPEAVLLDDVYERAAQAAHDARASGISDCPWLWVPDDPAFRAAVDAAFAAGVSHVQAEAGQSIAGNDHADGHLCMSDAGAYMCPCATEVPRG